jgi:hypothetical protein
MTEEPSLLATLPDETLLAVFKNLSQQELCQLAIVSSKFKRLARDPTLWRKVRVNQALNSKDCKLHKFINTVAYELNC